MKRIVVGACIVLILIAGAVGLTKLPKNASDHSADVTRVLVSGRLSNINLIEQTHPLVWELRPLVFRNLLKWNSKEARLESDLALTWSQNKNRIQFELDPHSRWQDGRPVVADDIAFSLNLHSRPESKSVYQNMYQSFIKDIKVLSPTRVQIETKFPSYYHLINLGLHLQILPRHFYEGKNGEVINANTWLGSADLSLLRFVPDRYLLFGEGKKAKLKVEFVPSLDLRRSQVTKSKAEWARLSWREGLLLHQKNEPLLYQQSKAAESGAVWLLLNHVNPHLAKTSVRQALMYGFNRDRVNELIHQGQLKISHGFWPASHSYASGERQFYGFDPDRARSLLAKAGYKDINQDGTLEDIKTKQALSFEVLVFSEQDERLLGLFSQAMRELGIRVDVSRVGEQEVYRRMTEGRYDAAVIVIDTFYKDLDLRFQFHSKRKQKWPVFHFERQAQNKLDQWIEAVEAEAAIEKRKAYQQRIDQLLSQEVPHLFWYEIPQSYWLKAEAVTGPPPF